MWVGVIVRIPEVPPSFGCRLYYPVLELTEKFLHSLVPLASVEKLRLSFTLRRTRALNGILIDDWFRYNKDHDITSLS